MKIPVSSRGLFALGFLLFAATNIAVLSGVASNRSGDPEAQIILSERELQLPYRSHEGNSGLALRLAWRVSGREEDNNYLNQRSPSWLNAEKLAELGVKTNDQRSSNSDAAYHKLPIPKEVFIVLENNGEPYRAAVKRAEGIFEKEGVLFRSNPEEKRLRENFERAENRLKQMRLTESRLFAIDAGLDPQKLRNTYRDRARYIITKALIEPTYRGDDKGQEVVGYITRLSVENIHVPLVHRQVFEAILAQGRSIQNEFGPPRYKVGLAYGSRLEPWIKSVERMDDISSEK
jgi:hypothetical protein